MKKLLYILSIILILLLTACDKTDIALDNHEYQNTFDEYNHYTKCICGDILSQQEHDYKTTVLKQVTCTEPGKIKLTCDCGFEKIVEVEKNSHNLTEWEITIEPSCISLGEAKRHCLDCNYEETKVLNKIPHEKETYETLNADCTHEGHIGGSYCKNCSQELEPKTTIEKTEHDFTPWETTIEANCMHIGQQKRTCKVCNKEEYQELPITSHAPVSYEDLEADCTHEGHTGGTYCKICNIELSPKTTVDKSTHT